MLNIQQNISLKTFNTFGIDVKAAQLTICSNKEDLVDYLSDIKKLPKPLLILGGGSNILFTKNFEGTIIYPRIKGMEVIKEDEASIWLKVGAGEEWDDLVDYCVRNDWYGLENLSYIPGNVGASPVQNIGAYGVEAQDCIEIVNGVMLENAGSFTFTKDQCQFGYRQSIFKKELKAKTVITSVIFKLSKQPAFTLNYGHIKEAIEATGDITLKNIRNTIIDIRKSKLPEPEEMGNAGSFFKNPVIDQEVFKHLLEDHPNAPHYPVDADHVKVPAGWLIETAGWKGKTLGPAGVHHQQALVLVNHGEASGLDILKLANRIIVDIRAQFDITLEPEVNVI
ncbi:MAG: UDP-N-acetylmuramate dehydrogenase [Marinilabiliaceae bacterium]|nr:UDP-N-acetylmuramate dehydrogenase [Marinilabiliaceae bacterium]